MYPIPLTETLAETKTCKHCGTSFPITDKDLEFYDKISPVFAGVKCAIPTPKLCPDCRQQRRLSFRNERKLYRRQCDATERDIVSIYSPDRPFKVYHQDFWWSDKWDPLSYGRDFNFARPFFEQFAELMKTVPRTALFSKNSENSEYTNHADGLKDCYLLLNAGNCERSAYGNWLVNVNDSIDNSFVWGAENSYRIVTSFNVFGSEFCHSCEDVSQSSFLVGCIGCENCFLSANLSNKKFVFKGVEWPEAEYRAKVREYRDTHSFEEIFGEWVNLVRDSDSDRRTEMSENSTWSDIIRSKNVHGSSWILDSENVKFSQNSIGIVDAWDVTESWFESSRQYECHACNRGNFLWFSHLSYDVRESFFADSCHNSSHLFACVGLRNKQYCVFNKQYAKEEYETLVPKIIAYMRGTGEWGEFFPSSISPFGYNETVAQEYYPLTREEALAKTFVWSDYEPLFPKVEKTIPAAKLPERIEDVPDDILNWAVECEVTKKPFRIIKQELEFYRKHRLPIPRRHPDQRHLDRMALRNPRKLFERKCDKCNKEMVTTYAPERLETVYCEECYEREVVG